MIESFGVAPSGKGRMIRLGVAVAILSVSVAGLLAFSPDSTRRVSQPLPVEPAPLVSDTIAPAQQLAESEGASTAAALRRITQVKAAVPEPTINDVTDGLMVELGLRSAEGGPETDTLKAMSLGALSGIRAITGKAEGAQDLDAAPSLQSLVAQALRDGKSDAYIDALVNEAVGRGEIAAPRALVTVDGRVDTHVLLASLVAQASRDAGIAQPVLSPGGEGVEVRIVQKADGETEKHHFYTVNSGDSLGAIAQKFYGDASRFMMIYEANRMIVPSPDKIRVGQRLVIPQA